MTDRLRARRLVIVVADLAGFHNAFQDHGDLVMAQFIDRFYAGAEKLIEEHGGRVIKFMGDAVLAVFSERDAARALEAVLEMKRMLPFWTVDFGLSLDFAANLNAAEVIEGEFGAARSRRYDAIGLGVNRTFMMGRNPGIRVTEDVYLQLSPAQRAGWNKVDSSDLYEYQSRA